MNIRTLGLLLVASLATLSSCSTEHAEQTDISLRNPAPMLERVEAIRRKHSVSDPHYQLALDITGDSQFSGRVAMRFDYQPGAAPLTFDFTGGEVDSLTINGKQAAIDYNGSFISVPSAELIAGSNSVDISYRRDYSRNGTGLYRFVDPQDQQVYLYTDFEPYAANQLFPHFDQPDLKAKFSLEVLAPPAWHVISTTRETSIAPQKEGHLWRFPETPWAFSSYIFSMHAGPYAVWEDRDFRYPLRLFARASLAEYVQPEIWFEYTRNGFDFFEPWFDFNYPFIKYDQVIVPDFNSGAMENIAAVTYYEKLITRSEYTRAERENLSKIILHEMAHMWFGDSTTMAWWDGLWLNESFASLMASLALKNEPEFTDAWHSFFLGYKQWAYNTDELVTTHSIQLPVPDTQTAETIFDGITYGKGASVLKQLSLFVGQDNFSEGIQSYVKANAFSNTELEDFIAALGDAANINLDRWAQDWLYQAGFNSLETELNCNEGKIDSLHLRQTATAEYPTLRQHAVKVALFGIDENRLSLSEALPVKISGAATEVIAARHKPCPALVYPNYEDWGFLRVSLDAASLKTVSQHINDLAYPLQRSMLWQDLWAMVQAAKLPLNQYLDIAYTNLDGESEELVLRGILRSVRFSLEYLELLGNQQAVRNAYGEKFESLIWHHVSSSNSDLQRTWFNAYLAIASTPVALEKLENILANNRQPAGLVIDQDLRWTILVALRRQGYANSEALLARERARDSSAEGEKRALQAEVIGAAPEQKKIWLEKALAQDESFRLSNSRTIVQALYPANQRHLMTETAASILASLSELESQHDNHFFTRISQHLVPRLCTGKNVAALTAVIESEQTFNPALTKALLVARQLDQRCIDIGRRLSGS